MVDTCGDTSLTFRELPGLSRKMLSTNILLLTKNFKSPDLQKEFCYICYTFFINLPELNKKSPRCLFETCHMYDGNFMLHMMVYVLKSKINY